MEMDAWLRDGGMVVTASERGARALTAAINRARRAEGLTAWPAPEIRDWRTFVRNAWDERNFDGRIVLNSLQEQALWAWIAAASAPDATRVEGARYLLADLAMKAHELLCDYAPRFLKESARTAWTQDAAEFSGWLAKFDQECDAGGLTSAARVPMELTAELQADSSRRAPLLLAGFDHILPTQRRLFDAWGTWSEAAPGDAATRIEFHEAGDPAAELAACALWCKRQLAANSGARLLVATQELSQRRGEIERAFLRFADSGREATGSADVFEFSLGVALGQVALARGACLVLRWLEDPIEEQELDWLLSTGQIAESLGESHALTAFMRAVRDRGLERTRWKLAEFISQPLGEKLPAGWIDRMTQAQRRLREFRSRKQTPLAWAELVPSLLKTAGWPGMRTLTSVEFQVVQRWQQTVDECASLGFDGQRVEWRDFLDSLTRAVDATLFAPESQDAPILIVGPAESAGLTADAIWFLGASEDAWAASGTTHPLLPLTVQLEAEMPHASAKLDWDVAQTMTKRMLASASEIHFSFARQRDGVDARPSRLIAQVAGAATALPTELIAPPLSDALTDSFEDASQIPFPLGVAPGGSGILTAQSQCPFKAFATARLGAKDWKPAEAGLNAKERGQLLHEVLHSVWGGPPDGIRTLAELTTKVATNLDAFVAGHVRRVLEEKMPARARASMPKRYLELEGARLTGLVTEWLRYEATRVAFTVVDTEKQKEVTIDGLALKLRLDRIDRLNDDSLLVIDYKSGDVSPKSWDLPRPDDVQLPLYAGFALDKGEECGGLVFAKVRAGEMKFEGRVRDAKKTLRSKTSGNSNLVRIPLDLEQLVDWKTYIEKMGLQFLAGRADVDPREYPGTCEYCRLQALCRVQENQLQAGDEEDVGA